MRGAYRTQQAPGQIRDTDRADLDPVDIPGHEDGYAYRPFYRRRMGLSRGVWESHNPASRGPDARSAPPLPLISRDFFTIRHCDQCHPALAADASTCSWRRNTDPSKVPSRERHDRVVTITELSPSRRDTDFTPLTVSIVALDEQTVGHAPGSRGPQARSRL